MLSPEPGYSALPFSFHAVTCATNHVLITQHHIRLWVHSSIKEKGPWGGLLQTSPVPGKMLLGKGTGQPSPSALSFSLASPRVRLHRRVQTDVYLLHPSAELVGLKPALSGIRMASCASAHQGAFMGTQPQTGLVHALPVFFYTDKPRVKSKAEGPGCDVAVLQHSLLLN